MSMINYGMIGCGMMGHEHLQNIALLEGTNISVIFEPDSGMARSAVVLAPNAMLVRSLDELLDFSNLDCLVISSPNYCHLEQMQRIAQKNPLPLLVEKPLFTSSDDQIAILEFSKTFPHLNLSKTDCDHFRPAGAGVALDCIGELSHENELSRTTRLASLSTRSK